MKKNDPRVSNQHQTRPSSTNPLNGLRWGRHRINTNATRPKVEPSHVGVLRHRKVPLDLRRVVGRHRAQAHISPRHVDLCVVEIRGEEQISRAVEPDTSVDALDVVHLMRDCDVGVDEERCDKTTDEAREGGSRAFDSRLIARHRRVLEGHRSWTVVSVYSKQRWYLVIPVTP